MNTSSPRFWLIGGILLAVAVLAASWSLLISPRMKTVSETRAQAVELQNQAVLIQGQAQQLQRQAQDLPAQIQALRRIQAKIPAQVDVPALLRDVQRLAQRSDVNIDALTPGQITVFAAAEPAPKATSSDSEPQPTPDATQPAPQPTPTDLGQGRLPKGVGLSYVPVSITATGEFANLVRFTRDVENLQRAYLITGVQLTRTTSAADTGSKQAANPLNLVMDTRIFVATDRLRSLPDQALQQVQGGS